MMPKDPDLPLTSLIDGHKDPFLREGGGEEWDEIFKGEEQPFSSGFYREQADEVRAKRAERESTQCVECGDDEGHESARRADRSLRGLTWRRS